MPRRSTRSAVGGSNDNKAQEMDTKILNVMLMYHEDEKRDAKVEDVANELGVNAKTKSFRERWSLLKKLGLIGNSTSGKGVELTKEGLDKAATPEYKSRMKDLAITPKTNKEHQEKIKKYFKKAKSAEIFDLLLSYGTLSKDQLSALVGVNPRSHGFFYSFKELRVKGWMEEASCCDGNKGKKFRLTDKAFKSKADRPHESDIDADVLKNEVSKGKARIESQKRSGPRSNHKKFKKEEKAANICDDGISIEIEEEAETIKKNEGEEDVLPVLSTGCNANDATTTSTP